MSKLRGPPSSSSACCSHFPASWRPHPPPSPCASSARRATPAAATPTYIVTQAGMAGWQVALIAIGAALAAVALTTIVVHVRFRTRLHPAAG